MSKALRPTIVKLRNKGFSYSEIGRLFGFSRNYALMLVKGTLDGRNKIRDKIRQRDKNTCQICGKKWIKGERRLDVHHVDKQKEKTRQYDDYEKEKDNMTTLCHKCHFAVHYKGVMIKKSKRRVINN